MLNYLPFQSPPGGGASFPKGEAKGAAAPEDFPQIVLFLRNAPAILHSAFSIYRRFHQLPLWASPMASSRWDSSAQTAAVDRLSPALL